MDDPRAPDPSRDLGDWHRDLARRRIAGVCAGVARALRVPVTPVRAAFLLAAVLPPFRGLGVGLYLVLWMLMPSEPGAPSLVDRVLAGVQRLLSSRGAQPQGGGPPVGRS